MDDEEDEEEAGKNLVQIYKTQNSLQGTKQLVATGFHCAVCGIRNTSLSFLPSPLFACGLRGRGPAAAPHPEGGSSRDGFARRLEDTSQLPAARRLCLQQHLLEETPQMLR